MHREFKKIGVSDAFSLVFLVINASGTQKLGISDVFSPVNLPIDASEIKKMR